MFDKRVVGRRTCALILTALIAVGHVVLADPPRLAWTASYHGSGAGVDESHALVTSPDGQHVYVTGVATLGGDEFATDYVTISYSATGSQEWASVYNGSKSYDSANAISVSSDGTRVYVTGHSTGNNNLADFATVAYATATAGTQLWVARYDGPSGGQDVATSIVVAPNDARVFVTGYRASTTGVDYATIAYDSTTGAQLWNAFYDGPGQADDYAFSIDVLPDGSMVFVTGRSASASPADFATVAYDATTGAQLWVSRFDTPGPSFDAAFVLKVGPEGDSLYVAGSAGGAGSLDYTTIKYQASTGYEVWRRVYGTAALDVPYGLDVNAAETRVFVTGEVNSPGETTDYGTVAYDAASGQQIWASTYNGPGSLRDTAVSVDSAGSGVYVTGSSYGLLTVDIATIRYSALSGAEEWVERFDGMAAGDDGASALRVSQDGSRVFITGSTTNLLTGEDYGTLAYFQM